MYWRHFVQGMAGNPQSVSVEYLDLIRMTTIEEANYDDTKEEEVEEEGASLISSIVSYISAPLNLIVYMMDAWMEERVKKILKKTQHLRRRYV